MHGLRADLYQVQNTQITKIGWHFVDTRGYPTWQASPTPDTTKHLDTCAAESFHTKRLLLEKLACMLRPCKYLGHKQLLACA